MALPLVVSQQPPEALTHWKTPFVSYFATNKLLFPATLTLVVLNVADCVIVPVINKFPVPSSTIPLPLSSFVPPAFFAQTTVPAEFTFTIKISLLLFELTKFTDPK